MKIGVVSDTHSRPLPVKMLEDFKKVDYIVHAGDFCSAEVLETFKKIKDLKAVYGNMDEPEVRKLLSRRQIITCREFSIGIFHGEGAPQTLLDKVADEFKHDKVDVIIFGHSHRAVNEMRDGILFFNPGSPNDTVFAPFCSYGMLDVGEKIIGRIVKL